MEGGRANSLELRVTKVVQRVLAERSITRSLRPDDDLAGVGLTSIDMISLVLSLEAEFNLTIPERDIRPASFRSVSAISAMLTELIDGG
jgi:acyl carrier protein